MDNGASEDRSRAETALGSVIVFLVLADSLTCGLWAVPAGLAEPAGMATGDFS